MFADLPSNIPIDGDVPGLGTVKNREFATVPAEPFSAEFPPFLSTHAAERAAGMLAKN